MASHFLCSDMIFEILTHMPLQALAKCRLVSKEWNNVTYESSFTQLHGERSSTISGYFVQVYTGKHSSEFVSIDQNWSRLSDLSLDFLPSPVEILACCNQGLIFCVSENLVNRPRIFNYYVCKPSTKQWKIIPNPKTKYRTERTAIMVMKLKPLHYKIVRLSSPKEK